MGSGYRLNSITGNASTWTFAYAANDANELTKVTTPMGGEIGWTYSTFTYLGNRSLREVATRWTKASSTAAVNTATFWTDPADTGYHAHNYRVMEEAASASAKVWFFQRDIGNAHAALPLRYEERRLPTHTTVYQVENGWATQATSGQPYVSLVLTTVDPGQTFQKQQTRTQVIDAYGNVTQQVAYDYAGSTTPARTYTMTYETGANYVNAYLRGLLKTATLTEGSVTKTLVSNVYDYATGLCNHGYSAAPSDVRNWVMPPGPRGNVTESASLGAPRCAAGWTGRGTFRA